MLLKGDDLEDREDIRLLTKKETVHTEKGYDDVTYI
jgi:hypothetical protein